MRKTGAEGACAFAEQSVPSYRSADRQHDLLLAEVTCEHDDSPELIDITRFTRCRLHAPGSFPPTHHSWLSRYISWVQFGDGLPTFQQSRV